MRQVSFFAARSLASIGIDIPYWYWSVGIYILVGILSTKEFGGNFLRFGGKPFFPQNGGWAPKKGGHDPPFKEKRGSCQNNNTKIYRPSFPPVLVQYKPRNTNRIPTKKNESVSNSIFCTHMSYVVSKHSRGLEELFFQLCHCVSFFVVVA
jgi:hypothetical protein